MNAIVSTLPLPLALRSDRQPTIALAQGFGEIASPAMIDRITANLFTVSGIQPGKSAGAAPTGAEHRLRQPDAGALDRALGAEARRLTPQAMFNILLGQLQQQLEASGLASLRERLANHQSQLAARAAAGQRLSHELEKALADAAAAQDAADSAAEEAGVAQSAAEAARAEAERLQAELDAMDHDDPAYAQKRAMLEAARQQHAAATRAQENAQQRMVLAGGQLSAALIDLETCRQKNDDFNGQQALQLKAPGERLSASARLQQFIGLLAERMAQAADEKLKSDSESIMAQLKARQQENLERARKQEEEQQRAREAEKKTGCIGKVFKWVGAAVAAVASVAVVAVGVLTANPALVVGGVVGLMLTVDSMVGMATGFSVVGKATELIGNAIAKALVVFGVSETLARQIGMMAATIAIMVAIIAVTLAAGNIGAAAQNVGRMVSLARQGSEILQVLGQLAATAGEVTHGIGRIMVADIEVGIAALIAAIESNLFASEVLRDLIRKIVDAVAGLHEGGMALYQQMADVIADRGATAQQILSNIRTTA